jgi:uroporphyrinogen III methyltransferase/synthase
MAEKNKAGKCWLVGAGPGDLGLVTLRAKECIEQAEVIVYDYLCNPEMLKWAPKECETIFAGKKAGAHTLTQDEINALLVEKAKAGKRVGAIERGRSVFVRARWGGGAGAGGGEDRVRDRAGRHFGDRGSGLCRNSGDASRQQFARDVLHRP